MKEVLLLSLECLKLLRPLVLAIYEIIQKNKYQEKITKKDDSYFTIADAVVQEILKTKVLKPIGIHHIIGEEDASDINIYKMPYNINQGEVEINQEICKVIDEIVIKIDKLVANYTAEAENDNLLAVIDPIDGTYEFCNNQGEQSTCMIGFADLKTGNAIAGLIYYPLTDIHYFGCKQEDLYATNYSKKSNKKVKRNPRLVTTNGSISKFLQEFIDNNKNLSRYKQGGAGNKIQHVIEFDDIYLSDRGMSRWDSCAGEAILDACDKLCFKLYDFIQFNKKEKYMYKESDENIDFIPKLITLTKYNCETFNNIKGNNLICIKREQLKPYSNCLGIICISQENFNKHIKDFDFKSLKNLPNYN